MRTLMLMRHAKSSWKTAEADVDRPLKGRGKRDAPRMGELLLDSFGTPDLLLSSSALRARQTAELVAGACEYSGPILLRDDLYGADAEDWLRVLRQVDDDVQSVLAIGHNPAIEELWHLLTGQAVHLVTASLAVAQVPLEAWADLGAGAHTTAVGVWTPRDLGSNAEDQSQS